VDPALIRLAAYLPFDRFPSPVTQYGCRGSRIVTIVLLFRRATEQIVLFFSPMGGRDRVKKGKWVAQKGTAI
ncbi:hypothetical protein, partial [Dickeya chrysanthemi]|uniref:hypothetical protein n=1 Tax=Dickeya chrysanthemi TaxID=556 RepID=UPI001E55A54D